MCTEMPEPLPFNDSTILPAECSGAFVSPHDSWLWDLSWLHLGLTVLPPPTPPVLPPPPPSSPVCANGDIDDSGTIDEQDIFHLARFLVGDSSYPIAHVSCSDFTQDGVLQGDDLIYLTRYVYAFPGPWVTFVGHEVQGSNDRRALARNTLATPLPASLYAVNGTRVYLQLPVGQRFNVAVMRLSGEVNVSLVSSITSDFSLQVNEASRVVSIMTHLQGFSGGLLMQRMGQGDLQLDLSQVGSFVQSVDAVGNVTTYNLVEPFLHVVLQLVRGANVLAISLCSPPEIPMQVSSLRLRFHSATVAGITAVHDSVNIAARENSTGLPGRVIGIDGHGL